LANLIGIIGGTGPEGKGLAARFARAGHDVFLGSRDAERGAAAAAELSALTGNKVRGGANADAARLGQVVILTVPYEGMRTTVRDLTDDIRDKILVSTVVPLEFSRSGIRMRHVEDGSAAMEAQLVAPQARVVAAFQNLSASHLIDLDHAVDGDVIVCSDHFEATREVIELAGKIPGVRGINGGPLANAVLVESMTALLINLNRLHKAETQIRIAGL
jgi:NADPH-dependent F420 reductase